MSEKKIYDNIIIGAGLYGLYSAFKLAKKNRNVLVLEHDPAPFMRATYINQARVHMGYHYPRSLSTAVKSAGYFRRFVDDYGFCIHQSFDQVYATASDYSWTNREQFIAFCKAAGIKCIEEAPDKFFKTGMCDGAYLTEEYTYDAFILRDYFIDEISKYNNVEILYNARIEHIYKTDSSYVVSMQDGSENETPFVINATYAGVNQILSCTDGQKDNLFKIKYELCEIILCNVGEELKNLGITVMDGPFYSIMPFGKTGKHSLTAVAFTPHMTSKSDLPEFSCQKGIEDYCSKNCLGNCNECVNRPNSAWPYMSHLANKYLLPKYSYTYDSSLFSQKPILMESEVDDSRPTVIRLIENDVNVDNPSLRGPKFLSVLSGKINTVYDLDEYLV